MNYKYKTTTNNDILTVKVTLSRLGKYDKAFKVDSAKVLNDLSEKFDIISIVYPKTLRASEDGIVEDEMQFRLQKEVKTYTKKKTSKTQEDVSE